MRVESATSEVQRNAIKLQTKVATAETTLAQVTGELIEQQKKQADFQAQVSAKKATLASLEAIQSQIAAEKIKQNTQFNEYLNQLKTIESNIGEPIAESQVRQLLESEDVSLPVKNAWELHHLFKQANPGRSQEKLTLNKPVKITQFSADGKVGVAATSNNELFRLNTSTGKVELIPATEMKNRNIHSLDVSNDGRWVVVAPEVSSVDATNKNNSLPVLYDLENKRWIRLGREIADQLQFSAAGNERGSKIKEKYFCQPQHVQFLPSSKQVVKLFLVDRRVRRGLNQFRCALISLDAKTMKLRGKVVKTKVAGQVFSNNPGLLTSTGCLASAAIGPDGETLVALSNSKAGFGLVVFSLDAANSSWTTRTASLSPKAEQRFLASMNSVRQQLDKFAVDFAPTAIKILPMKSNSCQVLIGSGKGELLAADFKPASSNSFLLRMLNARWLYGEQEGSAGLQFVESRLQRSPVPRLVITNNKELFSSNHLAINFSNTQPPAHKSAVRAIEAVGGQIFTASDSELIVWESAKNGFDVTARLFGQNGNIATLGIAKVKGKTRLISAANSKQQGAEIYSWVPSSNNHRANIAIKNLSTNTNKTRKIVQGTADKKTGSEAVVLAFDDGTYRYFDPASGSLDIGQPQQEKNGNGQEKITTTDFRNGRFAYFKQQNRFVMYSNSVGMVSWNINDANQTEPTSDSNSRMFQGKPANASNFFSSDKLGNNVVTSHPKYRDRILLWQLKGGKQFSETEIAPFGNSIQVGSSASQFNIVAQPAISPDGSTIACVARFRNAYRIHFFRTGPSPQPQKLASFDSQRRTNFRSIHFVDNNTVLVSQDQSATGRQKGRTTSFVEFNRTGSSWAEQEYRLPRKLAATFTQVNVSDVARIDGRIHLAGFGVPLSGRKTAAGGSADRRLISWNQNGLTFQRELPFSRRIAPRFNGSQLTYFVKGDGSDADRLETFDLVKSKKKQKIRTVALNKGGPVRSWALAAPNKVVAVGQNWLYLTDASKPAAAPAVTFSLTNVARRLELAGKSLMVHHEGGSTSLVAINQKQSDYKVERLNGFHKFAAMSPDGKQVATISTADGDIQITDVSKLETVTTIKHPKTIALTWVRADVLRSKGAKVEQPFAVATLSRNESELQLNFWSDGKQIKIAEQLSKLPLVKPRDGIAIKSFDISNGTGEFVSVVWDSELDDRANIWKWSGTDDPAAANSWFAIDISSLGQIESIDFSEVIDSSIAVDKIAPRIVIGTNNQGSKSMRLYALELALQFGTRPLLDLFTTDKLQSVDELIGARFSGDGKTLLTMTSARANVRLSSGWNLPRKGTKFEQQIREFQSTVSATDSDKLRTEITELERQIASLSSDTMQRLQAKISERESELAAEQKGLQSAIDQMADQKIKIESDLRSKFDDKTVELNEKIQLLQQEIGEQ